MTTYNYHPIANVFPMMNSKDIQDLAADIKENGLKNPIVIYEGKILDGRNRYEACVSSSIDPKTTTYTGDSPAAFVVSLNLKRRQLDATQRSCVGVEILPHLEKEAKARKLQSLKQYKDREGNNSLTVDTKGKATEQAANIVQVNPRYIQDAKKIKEESPETFEKMKSGQIDMKKGKHVLYKEKESQRKDTSAVIISSNDIQLYNCDLLSAPVADNSIDIIITDPPYPKEYLDCWKKLAQFAAKKLKDGGVLVAMSGQSYLPEVYQNMTVEGLSYYWTGCIKNTVSVDLWDKRTKTQWKPLLWYVKGKYIRTYQGTDVFTPTYKDTASGQDYHKWGQSLPLFSELVEKFSYAGETICDPFLGGGTTAIASLNAKRKFVGIELDKETFNIANTRISKECKL